MKHLIKAGAEMISNIQGCEMSQAECEGEARHAISQLDQEAAKVCNDWLGTLNEDEFWEAIFGDPDVCGVYKAGPAGVHETMDSLFTALGLF